MRSIPLGEQRTPRDQAGQRTVSTPDVRAREHEHMPLLILGMAIALALIAIAYSASRQGLAWADALFWVGLSGLIAPTAARLFSNDTTEQQRVGLLVALATSIYTIKVMHSPIGFTFFDEFLHWRTAADMLRYGDLFIENAMLPVSPLYPGIELVTIALASVSGLSIFHAGVLVIGVARIMQTLVLFRVFVLASGSPRIAGLAVLVYLCNPNYIFFGAQFAYESLALPLAAAAILLLLRHHEQQGRARIISGAVIIALIACVVVTHHASSYMLIAVLSIWTIAALVLNRLGARQWHPGWFTLVAAGLMLSWLLTISSQTIGYLAPHVEDTVDSAVQLFSGAGSDRQLFRSANGVVAPLLERIVGIGSVLLLLLLLPLGLLHFWRERRTNGFVVALAVLAALYPLSLAMRLTGGGWEIATRASATLFLGVGLMAAFALASPWLAARVRRGLPAMVIVGSVVLFTGGIIAGWSPSSRMPRPYVVASGSRSINQDSIQAALWMASEVGYNRRVAADRTNMVLMGSYGEQRVVTNIQDDVKISNIFLASEFGRYEQRQVRNGRIAYLVVDTRISTAMPRDGQYYEGWEQIDNPYTQPPAREVLEKFDNVPGVSRVFDSGVIRIYDTGAFGREP